jgi:hypothetical protein
MKSNHLTHCLVGLAAAIGLLIVFGVQAGTFVYLVVALACPLMMVFMMRGMMGGAGHGGSDHSDHQPIGESTDPAERTR